MALYSEGVAGVAFRASAPTSSALPRSQVPLVDSDLDATSTKLDAATARIASLEAEIVSLRASKETMRL